MSRKIQNRQTNDLEFVHITDTHFLNKSDETFHGLNTKKSFESVLSHAQTHYPDIDFLLITGDVSQAGTEESYSLFKSAIQKYNFPIYCVPGNHDTPKFLQHIIPSCPNDSITIVSLRKFSLILVNSCVANYHYGRITQRCLLQLENQLQSNEDQFNIIAIHHPPLNINSKWLDKLGLQNKTEFLELIKKYSQDALVLFGHIHQEIDQQLSKIRLLSTPSTCHQFKTNSERMHCIHTPPPAYRFIKLSRANSSTAKIHTKIHYIE